MESKKAIEEKASLLNVCLEYVAERKATAGHAIAAAREAANDDTKSSAGDKYETTREMMQQDILRNEQLLSEANRMERVLERITITGLQTKGALGSLIETNDGIFYLAISIGAINLNKKSYFIVSPEAPLGKLFIGKAAGESVCFNNRKYEIFCVK